MDAFNKARNEAYFKGLCLIIAETIAALGSVPSGHLYARIMDKVKLEDYQEVISYLTENNYVVVRHHVITWIGSK